MLQINVMSPEYSGDFGGDYHLFVVPVLDFSNNVNIGVDARIIRDQRRRQNAGFIKCDDKKYLSVESLTNGQSDKHLISFNKKTFFHFFI